MQSKALGRLMAATPTSFFSSRACKPFAQNILASCSNFYKTVIRVPMTSELSQQRNDAITYYTCSIISHSMKSFLGAFSSNSRLDVPEVKTDSVRALSGYFKIKFL